MSHSQFTFFGTAASTGVPVIGCDCIVCKSSDPEDKRFRTTAFLETMGKKILIDVGPDIHQQALRHKLKKVDGLILTHTHFDHIAGIDDLRVLAFQNKKPIPILASNETIHDLKRRMYYLFESKKERPDIFTFQPLDDNPGKTEFLGIEISYFFYYQVGMQVTGYRIGDFAFLTDIKDFDDSIHSHLRGVKTLVASAVDFKPTRAHISIPEAHAIANQAGAQKLIITHIGHELAHRKTIEKLPDKTTLAYDGMTFTFSL